MYKLSLVSVKFVRLHTDGGFKKKLLGIFLVYKAVHLFTVTHWTCFLLPFTVIYIGMKSIADGHKLRIMPLRKKKPKYEFGKWNSSLYSQS